jgi:hypothetical protein
VRWTRALLVGLMGTAGSSSFLLAACGGQTESANADASDAPAVDAAPDRDARRYFCERSPGLASTLSSCESLNAYGCGWRESCDENGAGFCSHAKENVSCDSCKPGEHCLPVWARYRTTSPCTLHHMCVECKPEANYPYNCAEAGP